MHYSGLEGRGKDKQEEIIEGKKQIIQMKYPGIPVYNSRSWDSKT